MPLSGHGRAGCCPVFTGCRYSLIQDRIVCKTNYDNQVGSAHHVRIPLSSRLSVIGIKICRQRSFSSSGTVSTTF